jgi:DNA-binding ferritin-like protein
MKTRRHCKKGGSVKTKSVSSENVSIESISSIEIEPQRPKKTKKYTPKLKKKNTKNIDFIIDSASTEVISDSASTEVISDKYTEQRIVTTFLQMLNTVKLYHWKTTSYSQHKATDELYTNLNTNIDSFVEVMLGKTGSRVNLTGQKTLPLLDYTNLEDFKKEIEKYKVFLINMNKDAGINITNNSDLLNVRDEILGNLNQFTYLLTFK